MLSFWLFNVLHGCLFLSNKSIIETTRGKVSRLIIAAANRFIEEIGLRPEEIDT